ncbi:hypothetical protein HWV62_391 [Athelia sp. TMB]|nr:hypothetical protein HWV62_391 [Athelia sp. TMB]
MEPRRVLTAASRTLSSSSLKERLSQLSVTPLRPVVAMQANIDFVPSRIPRKRRLQMLAVAVWSTLIPAMIAAFLMLWSIPPLWPLLVVYLLWIHCFDNSPDHGGRRSPWFRSMRFWNYFADYYPASLKKVTLHLMVYAPVSVLTVIVATGFSKAFPGIRPHLLTLSSNFQIPIYRDILLALGICSVSKKSCSNILKSGPGSAITIVVGGAAESLASRPGTADLTLRRRLGFIKIAITHGADLVPVFSFGENDASRPDLPFPRTTVYALQKKFQSVFGFTLPLFHGRGLLNYNLGLMPYRRRIVSVIGNPVHVTQSDKPTLEDIMNVQKQYIEELMRIWNTYKDDFAKARTRELNIVE